MNEDFIAFEVNREARRDRAAHPERPVNPGAAAARLLGAYANDHPHPDHPHKTTGKPAAGTAGAAPGVMRGKAETVPGPDRISEATSPPGPAPARSPAPPVAAGWWGLRWVRALRRGRPSGRRTP